MYTLAKKLVLKDILTLTRIYVALAVVEFATLLMKLDAGKGYVMPLHDTVHVGGVSESCKYNCHEECRAPGCSCTCHAPAAAPTADTTVVAETKACPQCGVKRPANEVFCRIDGSRLSSLLCGMCGAGMNPEDKFCFACGAPKGQLSPKLAAPGPGVVTVPAVEVDSASYEQQVLRGLQEELNVQVDQAPATEQTVVEQPAGTQGTFKLVSKPSPNKIRGPVRTVSPVIAGGKAGPTSASKQRPAAPSSIKLPVKPS